MFVLKETITLITQQHWRNRLQAYSFKTNKTPSDGGDFRTDGGDTNLTVVTVASLQHTIPKCIPLKSMPSCLTTLFNNLVQQITIVSTVINI